MGRGRDRVVWVRAALRAGMVGPMSPKAVLRAGRAVRAYGPIGAATAIAAARFGDRVAVRDDRGAIGYRELDARTDALAARWLRRGVGPDDRIALLCRNHRGLLMAMSAAARLGARIVLLNTDFAAPQLAATVEDQGITLLVHDDEFTPLTAGLDLPHGTCTAWADDGDCDLDRLSEPGAERVRPPRPPRPSTLVILSSGTTGAPKGARRSTMMPEPLALPGGVLSKIPFRQGETVMVAPPLFHGWGLTAASLALALGSTLVLMRRFNAAKAVDALARHGCSTLIAVPTMVGRMLDAPNFDDRDLSSVRIIATGGGPLTAHLTRRVMDAFGPVLYNFYGSTEASCITIATPEDLAAAPGCAGTPPAGTRVAILDEDGRPVPPGETGQVHVSSPTRFEGYTSGTGPSGEWLPVGDLGHLDDAGRLHLDGRADDMIVSGGENVYPGEIEELLAAHPAVAEAVVVGVPDPDFGQRLRAYVVASGDLDADQVKRHVATNLARYKVPREVVFLPELPRNATGKVVKKRLPD